MKWKLVNVMTLFAVAILAVVLASGRRSQAQATNPAPVAYTYKVVRGGREMKELERRLNDDARNGWRVCGVAALSFNDELVVILERLASAP